jgi:hypothetical protein
LTRFYHNPSPSGIGAAGEVAFHDPSPVKERRSDRRPLLLAIAAASLLTSQLGRLWPIFNEPVKFKVGEKVYRPVDATLSSAYVCPARAPPKDFLFRDRMNIASGLEGGFVTC